MVLKNNKQNVLITCAGGSGPIYLAKKLSSKYNIFLCDGSRDNVAPHLGFPFVLVPSGIKHNYIESISRIIKKYKINCIVPGADEELVKIALLSKRNQEVLAVIPSLQFIKTCLNKKHLMEVFLEKGISDISYFNEIRSVHYPAIAKPIFGRGSKEVHRLDNRTQLEGYLKLYGKKFKDIVVQDNVVGEEYSVSVIVNNLNNIIGIVPKKIICKKGITRAAVTEKNTLIEKICCDIVKKMNPCGPFNVQLIIKDKKIFIFEINPRLSTTAVLTDKAFGNEVDIYIKYFNALKIKNIPKMRENVFLYRYEENLFN